LLYVDRGRVSPPLAFREEAARMERLDLFRFMGGRLERIAQTTPESVRSFDLEGDDVYEALSELFHGKCAFCETRGHLRARYFRPEREAEPLARSEYAHLYYTWLRTDWGNVYLVCGDCSAAAGNRFPTIRPDRGPLPTLDQLESFANEGFGLWRFGHRDRRLLLDPCADRAFSGHLGLARSGRIEAFTRKGAETIGTFDLDRSDLVRSRADAFENYFSLLVDELQRGARPNVFDFARMEHGGAWGLLLRRILKLTEGRIGRDLRLSTGRLDGKVSRIWKAPIERKALLAAWEDVQGPVERATVDRPPPRGGTRKPIAIGIRDFKALQHLRVSFPPPVAADPKVNRQAEASALLILGENAAGKSSILEAMALALMDAKIRAQVVRSPRDFVLSPSLMGSEDHPPPRSATVTLGFAGGATLAVEVSDVVRETGATDDLPPVFAYGAFRQYAASSPSEPPADHVATLFKSDSLLANPEQWLLGLSAEDFAMVARSLQKILLVEGEYDIVERDPHNGRCLIVTKVGEGTETRYVKTPLRVVSSGFRSVLAMVCDVFAGLLSVQVAGERKSFAELEPVILIDEVEAHLHPRWKMQIMSALRRVLPKAMIIATTHDPLCLRGMHDGEVLVLSRSLRPEGEDPEGLPVFVEAISELPNVENLTIEQLLTSDLFSMFSTDAPATELRLARIGDLIAQGAAPSGLTEDERKALDRLRTEIASALPLGSSEVQRLVEEAVLDHVRRRRATRHTQLERLKDETRSRIAKALEAY